LCAVPVLQCSLACHKKCLETLAIQCGHKKLQGRLHLFGIDFTQASKDNPDGVPFIIRKCTSEIEARALDLKVFRDPQPPPPPPSMLFVALLQWFPTSVPQSMCATVGFSDDHTLLLQYIYNGTKSSFDISTWLSTPFL